MTEDLRHQNPGRPKGTLRVSERDRMIPIGHTFPQDVHDWIRSHKKEIIDLARGEDNENTPLD